MLKKVILIITGLMVGVLARENPFLPAKSFEELDAPTNVVEKKEDFEQQSTSLPSRARVLKYVVFGYQSLDGSIEEKRINVNKSVDWHDPLVVTKESVLLDSLDFLPEAPSGEKPSSKIPVVSKKNEKPKEKSVKVKYEDLVSFEAFKMKIMVNTKDKLIRHFMVMRPYKVVLDFKEDKSFYTKSLSIEHGAFKKVTLGNHKGYYRAAIELDGHYVHDVKEVDGGYEVILK